MFKQNIDPKTEESIAADVAEIDGKNAETPAPPKSVNPPEGGDPCPTCKGTGLLDFQHHCPDCAGSGIQEHR